MRNAPNGIRIRVRIRKAGFESQHGIQNLIEELCNLGIVDFDVKLIYFYIFLPGDRYTTGYNLCKQYSRPQISV
jgi:hypothetical protein